MRPLLLHPDPAWFATDCGVLAELVAEDLAPERAAGPARRAYRL